MVVGDRVHELNCPASKDTEVLSVGDRLISRNCRAAEAQFGSAKGDGGAPANAYTLTVGLELVALYTDRPIVRFHIKLVQ